MKYFQPLWNSLCLLALLKAWTAMTSDQLELTVLYFHPYIPFCVMLWLWSWNVKIFETMKIPYDALFGSNTDGELLPGDQINRISHLAFTALLTGITAFVAALIAEVTIVVKWLPVVFLSMVVLVVLFPIESEFRSGHQFFVKTISRVVAPFQTVAFADFLLADILTSLARAMADLERSICAMFVKAEVPQLLSQMELQCRRGAVHTNMILALPYMIRMSQCLFIYVTERDRLQLFNALKYLTAIPVIFSSVMKHHADDDYWIELWIQLWILASIINTTYSYFWDLEMDWGIHICGERKKSDSMYYPKGFYHLAVVSNFVIRIAWIYKLSIHVHYSSVAHMVVSLLEVWRRWQWILIRVECGLKNAKQHQTLPRTKDRNLK